jgi:hypothetical protein
MNTTAFWQKLLLGLAVLAIIAFGPSEPAAAETAGQGRVQGQGKYSLIEAAPGLFYSAMRYDKFFGDANTVHGGILERSSLLGNPGGVRQTLVDHGLYMDIGVTQFLQRNVSGGDDKKTRFNGSTDLWLWYDTGKAGLWPGGAAFVHGEGRWRTGINEDAGSFQSANHDQNFPDTDSSNRNWALSEWYLLQSLPANFLVAGGKMNFASWGDTNMLANRERSQFLYSGLVVNPIPGEYFPYTTLIGWLNWSPNKSHSLTGVAGINNGAATAEAGTFDTLTTKDLSYVFQYVYSYEIAERPGSFLVDFAYSNKERASFDISEQQLFGQVIGALPIDEKHSNYTLIGNFAQYLWVKEGSEGLTRHNLPPRGIGIFGRFGSHISGDLRDLTDELRNWEHAFEIFYNYMLTPAMYLSANTQVIRPADENLDTAYTLGLRLQLDF